ncbi:MAG: HAD hydrolase-like protein [Candidatus Auribacterota bacterium]|nr:HAD hydrolase-like protein [Candidatus Auribacterota bacterium]
MKKKDISLPLPAREWLVILDRDATIISSREIAYGCFEESFNKVISDTYPDSAKLSLEEYSRAYHPFERTGVYEVFYPRLSHAQMERIGELSWQFYLDNYREERFNKLLEGMDDFIRKLKAAGALIAILTASEGDGKWMRHYGIPVDDIFSVTAMRKNKVIEGKKPDAIHYILKQYDRSYDEAVTIGDNPKDHIAEIISIGAEFGLGCPEARQDLRENVDISAPRVQTLYDIFFD